ncbi:MAG: DUF1097 domain-containing protein [Gammaproteobacteria bacterium]
MSPLLALSLSIAVLGAIWTYLALSPLAGFVLVWAGFIAWGSFFHSGGDTKALVKTLCGNVYGIVIGWIALLIIFKFGVADMGPVAIASVVGATVFLIVIVASIEPLSAVPANVYGYSSIVAYALHQASAPGATPDVPGTGPLQNLIAVNFENPLVILIVSMVIGALAGFLSGQVANVITRKA